MLAVLLTTTPLIAAVSRHAHRGGYIATESVSRHAYSRHALTPHAVLTRFPVDSVFVYSYALSVSYLEIYNEVIRDLLARGVDDDGGKLELRETPQGVVIPGLTTVRAVCRQPVFQTCSQLAVITCRWPRDACCCDCTGVDDDGGGGRRRYPGGSRQPPHVRYRRQRPQQPLPQVRLRGQ